MRSYLLIVLLAVAPSVFAQTPPPTAKQPVTITVPAAAPKDVESIDAIVAALYDVISGPAGKARDWNRMRSLFIPGGRLMPTGVRPDGDVGIRLLEVNDFIATSGALMFEKGFTEIELARRVEKFGHIAHVFSTYEGKMEKDASVHLRGINSIQLMNDGSRWWVVSVFWEAERPGMPLPKEYLPNSP
ncbi:hypothetical protein M2650_04890 [Luteimonas sp. SX5]|uniref:Nuclear transport factor 2 family protein n=1 Tax=Luteimonas galliterrae TaxID=2940486 RepID=A0ABT0MGK0_9GAMM|nr:hypothetical protein [Luteimonas galliterrae]MCL1633978.1 hypothetical protein [Luteimonas galliterrae]